MKKVGFTLSEVIISLGIIGILAAITAPMLGSLTPDQDKIKVLKAYKMLTDVTTEVLNDPSLYLKNSGCEGLNCIEQPTHPEYQNNEYTGNNKFSYILASKLELSSDATLSGTAVTFTTIDGIEWTSSPFLESTNLLGYDITIDVNNSGTNQTYDEESTKDKPKPDRFAFEVDLRGNVKGADCLTKAYLANPNKLNDKKADYAQAKAFLEKLLETD
jgi:prepilin-type N-terminal cleavage/methylation domain-containing protein